MSGNTPVMNLGDVPSFLWSPVRLAQKLQVSWPWVLPYLCCITGLMVSSLLLQGRVISQIRSDLAQSNLESLAPVLISAITWGGLAVAILAPLLVALGGTYVTFFGCAMNDIRCSFSKLFSLLMWSQLPVHAVGSLVKAVVLLAVPSSAMFTVTFSPAVLFPQSIFEHAQWLHIYVSSLDVFIIWGLVQFWVVFSHVHKRSPSRTLWVPVTLHSTYAGLLILMASV